MCSTRQDRYSAYLAFIVLAASWCIPSTAQVNGAAGAAATNGVAAGAALGSVAFDATAGVLLRSVKESAPTVGIGPKWLNFSSVNINKSALNVVAITNGTNSKIEVESLSPSSGFLVLSALALPFVIPPQTQALITIEFLPTRPGNFSGDFEIRYRTPRAGALHKMGIKLSGKGVQQ